MNKGLDGQRELDGERDRRRVDEGEDGKMDRGRDINAGMRDGGN